MAYLCEPGPVTYSLEGLISFFQNKTAITILSWEHKQFSVVREALNLNVRRLRV